MQHHNSGRRSELAQQTERIRGQLADRLLSSIFWVGVLVVPLSVSRTLTTGWLPLYTVHLAVAVAFILLVLLRNRITSSFKSAVVISILFGVGVTGLVSLGLAAPSTWWLLGSWAVANALLTRRSALLLGLAIVLVLIAAALGHISGALNVSIDLNDYARQPAAWGMLIVGAGGFVYVTFQAIAAYNRSMAAALKDSMRQWVDGLPLGVLVLDTEGQAHYGNRRFEEVLGISLLDLPKVREGSVCDALGATVAGTTETYPDDRWPLLRALQGAESAVEDIEIMRQGELRRFKVTGRPVRNSQNEVTYAVGSFEDITERKHHELELQAAKDLAEAASQAKSQLMTNMSHELRTPMNAILGMIQLLDRTPLTARQQDYVRTAEASSRTLLRAVNDVLDFSDSSSGRLGLSPRLFRTEVLTQAVKERMQEFIGEKPLQLTVTLDPTVPKVLMGDDVRLTQVLSNLASNAVKFTASGTVSLSMYLVEKTHDSALIEFAVQDTGIGISPADQSKIFSGFYQADGSSTRRFAGTGVGLAVADRLVRLMGSSISVASTLGLGSTFSFLLRLQVAANHSLPEPLPELPMAAMPAERNTPIPAGSGRAGGRLHGLRILVVEDNRVNQLVAKRLLEAEGADVSVAHDGELGVEAVEHATAPFDAVLMDLQMPVMDGFEATRIIRSKPQFQGLPIIAVTANSTSLDRALCLESGMNDHVGKPFDIDVLVGIVLMHVGRATRADE